jgi:tRNA(Arg) A34 adenosine deaminase TadA
VSAEKFMRRAIAISRARMLDGEGGPFGAVVVRDGTIVGEGWNRVTSTNDPTAHAEIVAIRDAARRLGTFSLAGCEIYSSCEPCPMCLGAILWARLDRLYYANDRHDAKAVGFDDEVFHREVTLPPDRRAIPTMRLLPEEARAVFAEWSAKPDKIRY